METNPERKKKRRLRGVGRRNKPGVFLVKLPPREKRLDSLLVPLKRDEICPLFTRLKSADVRNMEHTPLKVREVDFKIELCILVLT